MFHFFVTKNGEQVSVAQDFYSIISSLYENMKELGVLPDDSGRYILGNSGLDGFITIEDGDKPKFYFIEKLLNEPQVSGGIEQDLRDLLRWAEVRDIFLKKVVLYTMDDVILKVNIEALSIR